MNCHRLGAPTTVAVLGGDSWGGGDDERIIQEHKPHHLMALKGRTGKDQWKKCRWTYSRRQENSPWDALHFCHVSCMCRVISDAANRGLAGGDEVDRGIVGSARAVRGTARFESLWQHTGVLFQPRAAHVYTTVTMTLGGKPRAVKSSRLLSRALQKRLYPRHGRTINRSDESYCTQARRCMYTVPRCI